MNKLNDELQALFNPKKRNKRELTYGDTVYRTGDKILQLVNNPDENVFNGDIGEVAAISYATENADKKDQLIVSFEGTEVPYAKQDFKDISLAYCCSIHKSQGSEFPIVVLPIVRGYYRMLKRNLIYTAITRGKEFLILCGEQQALQTAIQRENEDERYTMLTEKLQEKLAVVSPGMPDMSASEEDMTDVTSSEQSSDNSTEEDTLTVDIITSETETSGETVDHLDSADVEAEHVADDDTSAEREDEQA